MRREVRFASGFHQRPPVFDARAPDVQVRLRGSDRRLAEEDDLRPARGILTSVLLGVALWMLALSWWFIAR
jgi:hypothetical protein